MCEAVCDKHLISECTVCEAKLLEAVKGRLDLATEPWGCIYKLTSIKKPKKCYVGKDKSGDPARHRWKGHLADAFAEKDRRPLYSALRKADRESGGLTVGFTAEVIWRGPRSLLNEKEIYYIKKCRAFIDEGGYNLTRGGDGLSLGFKHSEQAKRNMSAAQINNYAKPGRLERQSTAMLRCYEDLAEHEKKSVAQLRSYAEHPERRAQQSAILRLRYEDPDERAKSGRAHQAYWAKPESHEKACIAVQLRYADPAEREKQRIGTTHRYEDPVEREKTRSITVLRYENPAERAKTGATSKRAWDRKTPEERAAFGAAVSRGRKGITSNNSTKTKR